MFKILPKFEFLSKLMGNELNSRNENIANESHKDDEKIIALTVYNKKLINSAKVIFTAMRNDAERGNLTAAKVREYRKKFFECEKDEQS